MKIRVFLKLFGTLLKILGLLMLVPAGVSLVYGEEEGIIAFLLAALITLIIGIILERTGVDEVLGNREGFALVAFGWLGAAITGALPYIFLGLSPLDALFESMSGFTTTGATILAESNAQGYWLINATAASESLGSILAVFVFGGREIAAGPYLNYTLANAAQTISTGETYYGLLFWRGFTQWLGGMGIILLFIAILPKLGVAGRQLFKAEVPGPTEDKIRPRIRETAKILWEVYLVLTAVEFILLVLAGMPAYDAICNTFSTMACGGFSPQAESIAAYGAPVIEVIVVVFMFLAGANFALHYRTMYVDRKSLVRDPEFRFYAFLVAVSIVIVLVFGGIREGLPDSLRIAAFQVVSIITTTGFTTADYDSWSGAAKMTLFVLMFTGACAGSTAGGIKLVRILLTIRYGKRELFRALHPNAVVPIKLKDRLVKEEIIHSILIFFALYILIFVAASVIFASVCSISDDREEAVEMICFESAGRNESGGMVCFGSDDWIGAERMASFAPEDQNDGDGMIFFVSGDWNETDTIFCTMPRDYKQAARIGCPMSEEYNMMNKTMTICTAPEDRKTDKIISAASAVAASLGNVGPGFGEFGPARDYSGVPGPGKLILIICMWIGRLEILTVLVLFFPDFWKN